METQISRFNKLAKNIYNMINLHSVPKKHPQHFRLQLENQLPDFDNYWYEYSWHNLPSSDHSVSNLTQRLFLHYMGKTQPAKYHFFIRCDMIA